MVTFQLIFQSGRAKDLSAGEGRIRPREGDGNPVGCMDIILFFL